MLIQYRFVGNRDEKDDSVNLGIPIGEEYLQGKRGGWRVWVLLPVITEREAYCEVHILCEGLEQWREVGLHNTGSFTDKSLGLSDREFDKTTEEDLYAVWDDGAANHMEAAQRLHQAFHVEIEGHKQLAIEVKRTHLHTWYERKREEARERGWEENSIPTPMQPAAQPFGPIISIQ